MCPPLGQNQHVDRVLNESIVASETVSAPGNWLAGISAHQLWWWLGWVVIGQHGNMPRVCYAPWARKCCFQISEQQTSGIIYASNQTTMINKVPGRLRQHRRSKWCPWFGLESRRHLGPLPQTHQMRDLVPRFPCHMFHMVMALFFVPQIQFKWIFDVALFGKILTDFTISSIFLLEPFVVPGPCSVAHWLNGNMTFWGIQALPLLSC